MSGRRVHRPLLINLSELRRARGITQAQLAKRVGCCLRLIRYVEAAARAPRSAELVARIAEELGVHPSVLSDESVVISIRAGAVNISKPAGSSRTRVQESTNERTAARAERR